MDRPVKDAEKKIAYKKLTKDELIAKLIAAENMATGLSILVELGNIFNPQYFANRSKQK